MHKYLSCLFQKTPSTPAVSDKNYRTPEKNPETPKQQENLEEKKGYRTCRWISDMPTDDSVFDVDTDSIPWLNLVGERKCKIVGVYDADTVTISVPYRGSLAQVKCRLYGIDSAERRTKNADEKKVAYEATEWLDKLINGKVLYIRCGNWGKWGGRMIGSLYFTQEDMKNDPDTLMGEGGTSINKMVIDNGYAYEYYGQKKRKFEDWFSKNSHQDE